MGILYHLEHSTPYPDFPQTLPGSTLMSHTPSNTSDLMVCNLSDLAHDSDPGLRPYLDIDAGYTVVSHLCPALGLCWA